MTRHVLRSGRGHPPLEAEALPAIDLRFVFTLQIHIVETCGLAMNLAGVTSLVTRALARLCQRLSRGRGGARGAGAVREARVKTAVAPGVLKYEERNIIFLIFYREQTNFLPENYFYFKLQTNGDSDIEFQILQAL